jgi:two-component system OmpR family response regulator
LRILLVEDEPGLVRTLRDLLARRGYSVEAKLSGEDGLAAAQSEAFDLMILDVMLPGIDGFEVCRRLRETDIRLPVILLTARGETHDKVKGFEGGADDYVTKPFDPEELLARIAAHIRRASFVGPTDLRTFDFDGNPIDSEWSGDRPLRAGVEAAAILHRTQRRNHYA